MASPDGKTPQVAWRVVIQMQLVYPPPKWTTGTALPVGTGKSVETEREVDLQLQGLMSWGQRIAGWSRGRKQKTAFYRWSH